MKRMAMLLIGALALGACGQKTLSEMSFSEREALAADIVKRCEAQGYGAGNPKQTACLQHEADREVASRQNAYAQRQRVAAALDDIGDTYAAAPSSYRAPVNCTSTPYSSWVGGPISSVNTRCY